MYHCRSTESITLANELLPVAMAKKRTFHPKNTLADARAGRLTAAQLRKAIQTAEEFGETAVARELRLYAVPPASFAGDAAPPEIRERVAQGVSALMAMGEPLSRTKQMLKKHGVIETLNRIARYPASTKNFEKLCSAGLEQLTAEAIVLDYPDLFDAKAVEVARRRLGR